MSIKLRSNTKHKEAIIKNAYNVIIHRAKTRVGTAEDVRQGCIYLGCGLAPDSLWYDGDGQYRISQCWGSISFDSIVVPEFEEQIKNKEAKEGRL
jgi:hypothetical protein